MAYMDWDESYDTGIESIDSQHRLIVNYINLLHQASREGSRPKVEQVLDELIDYTETHFAFEESLMEEHGYPHLVTHKKVHHSFTTKIKQYQGRFYKGEDITNRLLSDLKVWLGNHIMRDDNDYVPIVKAQLNQGWISKALARFFG